MTNIKEKPVSIRFDTEFKRRLAKTAAKLGLSQASIIRLACEAVIEKIEKDDYSVRLPLKFKEKANGGD